MLNMGVVGQRPQGGVDYYKRNVASLPSNAVKLPGVSQNAYGYKAGSDWRVSEYLPNTGVGRHQTMPAGWSPFGAGLPWQQQQTVGSDAQRQGAYLTGITQQQPRIDYMGKYKSRMYDVPFNTWR